MTAIKIKTQKRLTGILTEETGDSIKINPPTVKQTPFQKKKTEFRSGSYRFFPRVKTENLLSTTPTKKKQTIKKTKR